MRILYMPFPYGSAAIVSHEIIARLSKHNKVIVVSSNTQAQERIGLGLAHMLPNQLAITFPVRHVAEGVKVARRFKPDVIISQYHPSDMLSYAARLVARFARKPLIVRSDDIWYVPFGRFSILSNFIYRLNHSVILDSRFFLVNSSEHRFMVERIHHRPEGVVIHPNGVDTARFNPGLTGYEVKRRHGLGDRKIVMYSGTAAWFYGLELLPKAFALVAKEIEDARLMLVGLHGDQTHREALLRDIERQNIKDRTVVIPPVPYQDVPGYVASSDVCIGTLSSLPVNFGTIPTKVPQYMACGKPTIVAKGGVSRDLIIHNKTGIAFSGNHQDLANWIIMLLEDKNLAKEIGKEARNHVEKNYDWNKLVTQLEGLISLA